MNVVFFGTPNFVQPVLDALKEHFDVVSYNNLPRRQAGESIEQLNNLNPDVFVVAAYGKILSKEILNIPKYGCINIHPSLLPKYRGPSPIQTAILNGDTTTGITFIQMDEEVDHGPILKSINYNLSTTDTFEDLVKKLFKISAQHITSIINDYVTGKIQLKPQDDKLASSCPHINREDGYIDITKPPSKDQLDRMIRAYYPWPGAYTTLRIKNLELRIKLLPNNMIQLEGKKPVALETFFRGYPEVAEKISQLFKL